MKFREIATCSKLQLPKNKYGYQIKKNLPFQELM